MNKLFVTASAAAILAASTVSGFAEEINGSITAVNPNAGTVTLADGEVYVLSEPADLATLQVGQEVTITFDEGSDGKKMATEVMPAS